MSCNYLNLFICGGKWECPYAQNRTQVAGYLWILKQWGLKVQFCGFCFVLKTLLCHALRSIIRIEKEDRCNKWLLTDFSQRAGFGTVLFLQDSTISCFLAFTNFHRTYKILHLPQKVTKLKIKNKEKIWRSLLNLMRLSSLQGNK